MIHLGVHNHPIANGKCKEFLDKTRRLIIEEAICTHDAKTSIISLNASNTFLARYLFNDCSNGIVELFKGEQLDHIQDKFYELSSPNVL
jgi:hypothetical protein